MSWNVLLGGPGAPARAAMVSDRAPANGTATPQVPDELAVAGDEDDLAQGWAVLYPAGRTDLLDALSPLRTRRAAQVGEALSARGVPPPGPQAFPFDPGTTAETFRRTVASMPAAARPQFLLVLGDLWEVPGPLQQDLATGCRVGRLAFDTLDDYRAYAEKVLQAEARTGDRPDLLLYSSSDPAAADAAVDAGHALLVESLLARGEDASRGFGGVRTWDYGPKAGTARRSWASLGEVPRRGQLLFSLTHGWGDGGWTADEQRARQGVPIADGGAPVDIAALRERPFLPGGFWFAYACFAGGTPGASVFEPWLRALAEDLGEESLPDVLTTLSRERPFVSAAARAVLANPQGPLAMFGHLDLAFTYAMGEVPPGGRGPSAGARERAVGSIGEALGVLAARGSAGAAHRKLVTAAVNAEQTVLKLEQRGVEGTLNPQERIDLAHAWMARHDLRGFLLLGDPAARLSPSLDLDKREEAVLAVLRGESPGAVAARVGLSEETLGGLVGAYRAAGRAALDR